MNNSQKKASLAKISRPKVQNIIRRSRIFSLLDKAVDKPVTWIFAPAGSGKTTLISSYLDSKKLPCLWYQVDEGDADIPTFFYYMGLAAKKAAPRYRKSLPLLTPEYLMGIPTFTRRYFEELYGRLTVHNASRRHGFVIVLDNYQDVPADSNFHEVLIHGLDIIPEGINIIALSRAEPPPHFARLKANNKISFVGWDDIRFTLMEAKGIIKKHATLKLKENDLMQLYSETDGWIAGLILLLESVKGSECQSVTDSDAMMLGHSDTKEVVFDYLAKEVFNRMDKEKQDFLLKTSYLPEISTATAERLTGIRKASAILSELNRNQFFTDRLARTEPIYRYHPLFREFLLSKAKESFEQKEITLIQRTAARLLKGSGRTEESARLLIDARDWEGLTELILTHAGLLIGQGRNKTLQEWIAAMPEERIRKTPWLLYWLGACKFHFNPAESLGLFERAFKSFKDPVDTAGIFLSWAGVVESIFYSFEDMSQADGWVPVLDKLMQKYSGFPSAPVEARVSSVMFNILVMRRINHSDFDLWLEKALSYPDSALKAHTLFHLAFYHICKGDIEKAELAIDSLRQTAGPAEAPPFGRLHLKLVEIIFYVLTGAYARGLAAAVEGLRIADETGVHILDLMLAGHGMLAAFCSKDQSSARAFSMKMPSDIENLRPWDGSFYHYVKAFESFMAGDCRKAAVYIESSVKLAMKVGHYESLFMCHFLSAHIHQRLGKYEKAEHEIDTLAHKADIDIVNFAYLFTKAQFALERKDEGSALKYLKQGTAIGKEKGYAGNYMGFPVADARLCAFALDNGIETGYIREIIKKLNLIPDEPTLHNESWPHPLKIYTLGKFEIIKDDEPLVFAGKVQKKPLEMLKTIIAFGGENVSEERLTDALWPEAEGDVSRISFKTTLHRLRKLIGNNDVIQFSEGKITLDPKYCWVDAWAFQHILGKIEGLWKDNKAGKIKDKELEEIIRLSENAIGLYKGHFLSGEDMQPWALSAKERFKSKFIRLVKIAGGCHEDNGDYKRAIEYYEKALETDDLEEEFYRRIMLCCHKTGTRAKAIAVYNRCRDTLSAVLGIVPSPETTAALNFIKQRQ